MALRNSKEWRRSRSSSFLDNVVAASTPPASPRRPLAVSARRAIRFPTRIKLFTPLTLAAIGCSVIFCIVCLVRSDSAPAPLPSISAQRDHLRHPNFDFDSHLGVDGAHNGEDPSARDRTDAQPVHAPHSDEEDSVDGDDDDNEDAVEAEQGSGSSHWKQVEPPTSRLAALPFLPYTCDQCTNIPASDPFPPMCSKYSQQPTKPVLSADGTRSVSQPLLNADVLDQSVMFAGTGADVRRVLKRAMKSSLYGMKRDREGKDDDPTKFEDEEPFRILILGGSVSNCRGVDPKTTCWHAGLLRWFQQNLPMEGDRDFVPDVPSRLVQDASIGPIRLDGIKAKRSALARPANDSHQNSRQLVKRAAPKSPRKKNKSKKTRKKKPSGARQRPSTRLINGSKSATGSSFFAYCYEEEMDLRGKNFELGKGPDLVVLEYGVNDVVPHDEVATRDFEKHLRALRSLPSRPAVVVLEAASLLLASTTSFTMNAEYLHLPAAQFYDVPVLSAKQALLGPHSPFASTSTLKMQDLFLPDQHHPNDKGHEFLSDMLISYLERQACIAQREIIENANARLATASPHHPPPASGLYVEPALDVVKRVEEAVRPLPPRSLFTPFPAKDQDGGVLEEWILPLPQCIQVGNSKSTVEPIYNNGWSKYGWARDKQYLIADKPGSIVTYEVQVGSGGTIMADWLRSRFYDLGNVAVYLDQDRSKAVTLAGYWDLGWSIGVPTEIFTGVAAGLHQVTFEVLAASKSSHPSHKTNFRLIGIIST
ncbi:SGNH/GDSL hydrolase family protein [Sporobolomyces koalae]|uniref:SGNH/GDSL hydrolase family protein n=1 Tax=Sporobolomyces koalae TaxID=500713 RepID=UPI0031704D73